MHTYYYAVLSTDKAVKEELCNEIKDLFAKCASVSDKDVQVVIKTGQPTCSAEITTHSSVLAPPSILLPDLTMGTHVMHAQTAETSQVSSVDADTVTVTDGSTWPLLQSVAMSHKSLVRADFYKEQKHAVAADAKIALTPNDAIVDHRAFKFKPGSIVALHSDDKRQLRELPLYIVTSVHHGECTCVHVHHENKERLEKCVFDCNDVFKVPVSRVPERAARLLQLIVSKCL